MIYHMKKILYSSWVYIRNVYNTLKLYCLERKNEVETIPGETLRVVTQEEDSVLSECSEPFEILSMEEINQK